MDVIRRSVNWLQVGLGVGLGMLVLGKVATAQETMLYVDQVVPSQVSVGQVFTIQGEFPGMTSAAAFLSDGMFGLPLTVLEVTEQQILARIDAIPWPMTGTLHVMNQEGVRAISNQTWQGDGVTLDVIGGSDPSGPCNSDARETRNMCERRRWYHIRCEETSTRRRC